MGLLRADLQGVANSLRRDGRAALAGRLLPPLVLGAMYWLIGRILLANHDQVTALLGAGDPIAYLVPRALSPCPVVAGWIGFAHGQRQLFEAPELPLWLGAPVWRGRAALQVLLRAAATALLWAAALALPLILQLLQLTGAGFAAYAVLPIALAAGVLPVLCAAFTVQLLLMRLAHGRAARTALSAVSTLAAFGFPLFLLAEVFAGAAGRPASAPSVAQGTTSPLLGWSVRLVEAGIHGELSVSAVQPAVLVLLAALLPFLAAAALHPVALENHRLAHRPRRFGRRGWPAGPVAALRRKELAQLLQQPGAMLHMLLVGAMVWLLAAERMFVGDILAAEAVPVPVTRCAAMLALWFVAVLMLLYAHMGRFAIHDGAQWPLYLQAPVHPGQLLRAKLQVVAVLLLWPVAVAGAAGVHWFDATLPALLAFLLFALCGNVVALSIVAVVGTWPWLVRREPDGRLTQGSRGLLGSLVLVLAFYLSLSPALAVWIALTDGHDRFGAGGLEPAALAPLLLGAALAFALLLAAVAAGLCARNYRRLLRPR